MKRKKLGNVGYFLRKWGLVRRVNKSFKGLDPNIKCGFWVRINKWVLVENSRPTTRFGLANGGREELEIHGSLLLPGRERDRNTIILHEIAHVILDYIDDYGRKDHGKLWRAVMRQMGEEPATTYDFEI